MNISYILKEDSTFKDLVKELDLIGEGFLPIVDSSNRLIGIVTDGDIRRSILNNTKDIDEIINVNPLKALVGISRDKALQLLKQNHRRHLPIIDENNLLVDIIKLDDWSEIYRPNKVIIMAGGLGSRLGELTKNTPKPMLNIGNKPILENLIKSFRDSGFYSFLISVNYKSEVIKEYFGDGSNMGVDIQYLEESKPLGTAGALSLINPIPNEPIFVVNGDILSSINFEKMLNQHIKLGTSATMAISKRRDVIQYGVVEIDKENNINEIREKPVREYYINGGAYILSPNVVKEIPKDQYFDMPSLFNKLSQLELKTSGYVIEGFWLDIGLKSDYQKAISIFSD